MSHGVYTRLSGPNQLGGRRTDGQTRSESERSDSESEREGGALSRSDEKEKERERGRERLDREMTQLLYYTHSEEIARAMLTPRVMEPIFGLLATINPFVTRC